MNTDLFFRKIRTYHELSKEAESAWTGLFRQKIYRKGENFINEGQHPRRVAFVMEGLFSQYYTSEKGESIIKYFFPEDRFAASVTAMLTDTPSMFTITAIETTIVLEYDFLGFKKLIGDHPDVAMFYIRYMEQHWIIEKEPLEISFRAETAKTKYQDFFEKLSYVSNPPKKASYRLLFRYYPNTAQQNLFC
ncbi:MAG: Crp/Fnr family transcriptional regulator [Bacteroidota bacterium]